MGHRGLIVLPCIPSRKESREAQCGHASNFAYGIADPFHFLARPLTRNPTSGVPVAVHTLPDANHSLQRARRAVHPEAPAAVLGEDHVPPRVDLPSGVATAASHIAPTSRLNLVAHCLARKFRRTAPIVTVGVHRDGRFGARARFIVSPDGHPDTTR
jgi:hypothetical protein